MRPRQSDWTLDGTGNWERIDGETRQHSSFNEVTLRFTGIGVPQAYDDNGNQTDNGVATFNWDYLNRLRRVARKDGVGVIAEYTYDADGRRIRKVVTNGGLRGDPTLNGTTTFHYDGWRVVEERDDSDDLTQQYVYGVYIDEVLLMDRDVDADNSATGAGDQRVFYHQNTLYLVYGLTDATATIREGYKYEAYGGQTVYQTGPNNVVDWGGDDIVLPGGRSDIGNPYMFTGRRLDAETGLYYYRNRYLGSQAGRFTSRDPIGTWGDMTNLGNG